MGRRLFCPARRSPCWAMYLFVLAIAMSDILGTEIPGQEDVAPPADGQAALDLAYVPRDAVLVVAVRPATLLRRDALAPVREALDQMGGQQLDLDIRPAEVAQVTGVVLANLGREPRAAMIVRTNSSEVAGKLVARLGPSPERLEFAGQAYFRQDSRICYFQPDDQTVVCSSDETAMRRCILAGTVGAGTTKWAARWKTVAGQDVAAVVNTSLLRAFDVESLSRGMPMSTFWQISPLWQRSDYVLADLRVSKEIALRIECQCANDDEARMVQSALLAAVAIVRNALSAGRDELTLRDEGPASGLLQSVDLVDEILEKSQIVRQDANVGVVTRLDEATTRSLTKAVPSAAVAVRQAGSRSRSLNNLKQIGLAMHNYHDTYKSFPAAVQPGPKGIPHSWRVSLLPFLEQYALYDQYRQDEPWDSENNRRVLAAMPDVYHCPLDGRDSKNASYFVLVGPDTAFPKDRAAQFANILDGTSNTLMAVESKQATPWTKPEDIPFGSEQPVPKLGGWYPDGFFALMCDGAAQFLPRDKIKEQDLRLLIMRADGNPTPAFR